MQKATPLSRPAAAPAMPVFQARAGTHALPAPAPRTGAAPAERAAPWGGPSLIDVPTHSKPAEPASGPGLPAGLRTGLEALSGLAMDDVRVHRNSPEPARLGALAFARGSDIHLGPGQERHLPHEAWHVVQQKQGRVAATAQMKGLGLNDDAGLEAEADRMGAAAAQSEAPASAAQSEAPASAAQSEAPASAPLPHREAAGPATVQRIVKQNGVDLPKTGNYSKTVAHYHGAPERYVLRETESPAAEKVHLLESPKRYLIGEAHDIGGDDKGTSRWAKTVEGWCSVKKLREGEQASVSNVSDQFKQQFASQTAKHKQPSTPTDFGEELPLENVHERLLTNTAASIELLKDVCSNTMLTYWRFHKARLWNALDSLDGHLFELVSPWYEDFINAYQANYGSGKKPPTLLLKKLYQFHLDFRNDYVQALTELHREIRLLIVVSGGENNYSFTAAEFKKAKVHMEEIQRRGTVLIFVLEELVQLLNIQGSEYSDLRAALFPAEPDKWPKANEQNVVEIASPTRERAMIANLLAVPDEDCPVLVQIGDDHVKKVVDGLQGKGVAVPLGVDLDQLTVHKGVPKEK